MTGVVDKQFLAGNVGLSHGAIQTHGPLPVFDPKAGVFEGQVVALGVSKAALNMVAKSMSNDLKSRGVITVALHPGWVQTRMGGAGAPVTVAQCVAGQQALFDRLKLLDSGHFFNYDGRELPW